MGVGGGKGERREWEHGVLLVILAFATLKRL